MEFITAEEREQIETRLKELKARRPEMSKRIGEGLWILPFS